LKQINAYPHMSGQSRTVLAKASVPQQTRTPTAPWPGPTANCGWTGCSSPAAQSQCAATK